MDNSEMIPLKPYIFRAIYQWILDNELTPFMLVDAEFPGAVVPQALVEEGRIVLNLRPQAIHGLDISNELVEFNARFSGKAMQLSIPMAAILAIYAKENGQGMMFESESSEEEAVTDDNPGSPPPRPTGKPKLRVVK
ncbi:MAG: ClpXP protease specificity-enhancing factor [Methylococcales bacterium]|nr:ClpXP protease specificity-enhancing factor [Methylococcales bacterium]